MFKYVCISLLFEFAGVILCVSCVFMGWPPLVDFFSSVFCRGGLVENIV